MVPDVNWMLTISSLSKALSGSTAAGLSEENSSKNGVVAEKDEMSIREEELSTRIIFRNEGIDADSSFFAERSGTICFRSVIFSLGGLYGRFVSVPIIKCSASRCDNAAMTCGALKAGFNGTCSFHQHL